MARSSFPPQDNDFARALLLSAEHDEPSAAAYAKAASALGVGFGAGLGASVAAPAIAAASMAGVGTAARWSGSVAARLAALGVSGALLVGAGAFVLHPRSAPSSARPGRSPEVSRASLSRVLPARPAEPRAMPAPAQLVPAPAAQLVPAPAQLVPAPAQLVPAPAQLVPAPAPVSVIAAKSAPATPPGALPPASRPQSARPVSVKAQLTARSSLAEQVQSLDRARVALGSADPGAALREIARYRQAWPDGVFLTEASVLEIEALAARGERSLAAARASAFVAAHPDSPQVGRLRALMPAETH